MVTIGNYTLFEEVPKNRIVITLPQTLKTITSSVQPIEDRRESLTDAEKAVLLQAVKAMYEGWYEMEEKHENART